MKDFFDLQLCVSEGVRPGKRFQKIAENQPGLNIGDLVNSMEDKAVEIKSWEECKRILTDCYSCQSEDEQRKENYFNFWAKFEEIKIIGLFDPKDGKYIARCLLNVKKGTYAPVYGIYHFLLEARLIFAGYQKGGIISRERAELALCKLGVQPDYPVWDAPKSISKRTRVIMGKPKGLPPKYWKNRIKNFRSDYRIVPKRKEWELYKKRNKYQKKIEKAQKSWGKYLAKAAKHGVDQYGNVVYWQVTTLPINKFYFKIEKDRTLYRDSTIFLDNAKMFLEECLIEKAGYYRKNRAITY